MVGKSIGRFRILDKLGEGGMGAVYLAEHELIGKRVAVKVLLPELATNQEVLQRFFHEAVAAASIRHPGIVEIFDYGTGPGSEAFIVMEALDGEPLAARLARGPIAVSGAVRLVRQVAGVLEAAHAAGIVHRDLKPDNLFIVRDPEVAGGERVKLLDFGIARLIDTGAGGLKTRTGAIVGTPAYMAPEQCAGARTVDHRADLYALGIISYEMLAGAPPFTAGGLGELLAQHMFEAPVPLAIRAPAVPPELDALVLALLAKDPDHRRPQSAGELARRLAALERGNQLASTPAPGPPLATTVPPHQTTLGAAAAQALSMPDQTVRARRRGFATAVFAGAMIAAAAAVLIAVAGRVQVLAIAGDRPPIAAARPPAAVIDAGSDATVAIDAAPVAPPPDAMKPKPRVRRTTVREKAPPQTSDQLRRARAALASGKPRRAIELARQAAAVPAERQRAIEIMVLGYCSVHNDHAARAVYRQLAASSRGAVRARCRRFGVALE